MPVVLGISILLSILTTLFIGSTTSMLLGSRETSLIVPYWIMQAWVATAPFVILGFERNGIRKFYDSYVLHVEGRQASPRIPNQKALFKFDHAWKRSGFVFGQWVFLFLCPALFIWAFYEFRPFLEVHGGLKIGGEAFFNKSFAYALYAGILVSFGFRGVFRSCVAIHKVVESSPPISVGHADTAGGLAFIGRLAGAITLLFATGSLFLPLVAVTLEKADYSPLAVQIGTTMFAGTVFASFLFPILLTYFKLKPTFDRAQNEYLKRFEKYRDEALNASNLAECEKNLTVSKTMYGYASAMNAIPVRKDVAVWVTVSVLLPFALMVLGSKFH